MSMVTVRYVQLECDDCKTNSGGRYSTMLDARLNLYATQGWRFPQRALRNGMKPVFDLCGKCAGPDEAAAS